MKVWFVFSPEYQCVPWEPKDCWFQYADWKPSQTPAHILSICSTSSLKKSRGNQLSTGSWFMRLCRQNHSTPFLRGHWETRPEQGGGERNTFRGFDRTIRREKRERSTEWKKNPRNYLIQYLIHRIQRWTNQSAASEEGNWFWDMLIMLLTLKPMKYSIELRNTRGWEILLAKYLIHQNWKDHGTQDHSTAPPSSSISHLFYFWSWVPSIHHIWLSTRHQL